MSNATAAGPSRGILDMIFGSKSAEEPHADGPAFSGLMEVLQALKEKKEEISAELGRTPGETTLGKNGTEVPVAGMPGIAALPEQVIPLSPEDPEQKERLSRIAMLMGQPVMLVQPVALPQMQQAKPSAEIGAIEPEQVNQALQAKSLPPLTSQEMKLLGDVNQRLAQAEVRAQQQGGVNPQLAAAPGVALPTAPREMGPQKLKGAEVVSTNAPVSGAPEKMMSTETYLQMHEGANKATAKELTGKAPEVAANGDANPANARAAGTVTASAVAGLGQKDLTAKSRKGANGEDLPDGKAKADAAGGGAFGSLLAQQSGETMRHDVYLPGKDKPEELRRALVGELGTGVALHAGKGGGEMRLVLHPDDMGEVKLKVGTKNGKVEVQVMAENEATAKLIRGGAKELEKSLREQNLALSKFEVSVGADLTTVNSLDTRTNLSDQFFSQNQPSQHGGFSSGMNGDESRGSRWGGDHGGGRTTNAGYASQEDSARSSAKAASFVPKNTARDSSRRLDVVA